MAKKSALRQEYEKQIKRIKSVVKRGEKKGIIFESSPIPQIPKRVTRKMVENLKEQTYRDIWSKGYTVNESTGELNPFSIYEYQQAQTEKRNRTIAKKRLENPYYDLNIQIKRYIRLIGKTDSSTKEGWEKVKEYENKITALNSKILQDSKPFEIEIPYEEKKKLEQQKEDDNLPQFNEAQYDPYKYEFDWDTDTIYPDEVEEQEPIKPSEPQELKLIQSGDKGYAVDPETGEVVDTFNLPKQSDDIIHYLEESLSGTNATTSALIYETLQNEINDVGKEGVAKRIAESPLNIRTLAEDTVHAYYAEVIRENGLAILTIITGGNVSDQLRRELDESAQADRPYKPRRSSNRHFYRTPKHLTKLEEYDDEF